MSSSFEWSVNLLTIQVLYVTGIMNVMLFDGALEVTVIVVENGTSNPNLNPRKGCLNFTLRLYIW